MTAYSFTDGKWMKHVENKDKIMEWIPCSITDVPVDLLMEEWSNLIMELSNKEARLTELKEL